LEPLDVGLALLAALLVAELARLDALDPLERELLEALFVLPFLDVEREVDPPLRFVCARPRLLPRRD
jgi:hypothetical protein